MRYTIAGVPCDDINPEKLSFELEKMIEGNKQYFLTTPNPEIVVLASKDTEFQNILKNSDLALPDGIGLVWAVALKFRRLIKRITGSVLVECLAKISSKKKQKILLFGGEIGIGQRACEHLVKKFPGSILSAISDGSKVSEDGRNADNNVVQRIQDAHPDILIVALGHGKQEKFIYHHLNEWTSVKIVVGVGGVFDYLSGKVLRAPKLMRYLGLEWMFRLFFEPHRIKRIFNAVVIFRAG